MDYLHLLRAARRLFQGSLPGFALCLALGCTHLKETTVVELQARPEHAAVVKKEESKREWSANSWLAIADFRAKTANDTNLGPQEKLLFREQARKSYQKALKLDPKCLAAYLGLASVYQEMDDYDRAIATYQQALKEFPKSAVLWHQFGMCQARRKNWDEAIASLRSAHELDVENRSFINALGFCMARAGRIDDSYAFFEQTLGEARAHYNVARVLHHLNKPDECLAHLNMALKANPNLDEAKQLLAELQNPSASTDEQVKQVSLEGIDE